MRLRLLKAQFDLFQVLLLLTLGVPGKLYRLFQAADLSAKTVIPALNFVEQIIGFGVFLPILFNHRFKLTLFGQRRPTLGGARA